MTLGTEAMELTPGGEGASVRAVSDGEEGLGGVGDGGKGAGTASFPGRVLEWFSRSKALDQWRVAVPQLSARAIAFTQRAEETEALAQVVWTTAGLGGQATACELYRQSTYWALCALDPKPALHPPAEYAESVWSGLDEALLTPLAPTTEERDAFRDRLRGVSFVRFAELPPSEQMAMCVQLRSLVTSVLNRLRQARRGYDRDRRRRVWRLCSLPLAALLVLLSVLLHRQSNGDLAEGTTWRPSSSFIGGGGCTPPQQNCAPAKDGWFFHTEINDRDPWIEFEIDGVKDVSRVEVQNRTDCCGERAIPLAIEVSLDHNSWQQVAERRTPFTTWVASFSTVQASWVRVHLLKKGPLHLRRVQIFR